jgi:type VI secretion system secreted protein Hcp
MAYYMKYGSIDGAATTQGFEKWIEITSFQWGVARGLGSATRGLTNREGSEPSVGEVVVTKESDVSSTSLLQESLTGLLNNKVVIKVTTTTKGSPTTYTEFEFTDAGVSHFSMAGGGDMFQETVGLNFTKVMYRFSGLDAGLSPSPKTTSFDLTTMKGDGD